MINRDKKRQSIFLNMRDAFRRKGLDVHGVEGVEAHRVISPKSIFCDLSKERRQYWSRVGGFSLAEAMIALLMVSIIMAAMAPIMSKKIKLTQTGYGSLYKAKKYMLIYDDPSKNGTEENIFRIPAGAENFLVTLVGGGGSGGEASVGSKVLTSSESGWTVPEGVTKIRVYMVGGGGGGASGGAGVGEAFGGTTGSGSQQWTSPGSYSWTVPSTAQVPALPTACTAAGISQWTLVSDTSQKISPGGALVNVTACGAGGGGAGRGSYYYSSYLPSGGGSGGYFAGDMAFSVSSIPLQIGGGGGGGAANGVAGCSPAGYNGGGGGGSCNCNIGCAGNSQGGTGGGRPSSRQGAAGSGASGAGYGYACSYGTSPYGTNAGTNANASGGASTGTGARGGDGPCISSGLVYTAGGGGGGSTIAGGGGSGGVSGGGGGGGAPTIIGLNQTTAAYYKVLGGGGGGAGVLTTHEGGCAGGAGGGGGGESIATGASAPAFNGNPSGGRSGTGGASSVGNIGGRLSISGYCDGGDGGSGIGASGTPGKNGYLKFTWNTSSNSLKCAYNMPANGSGGGGGGQVWIGEIDVVPGQQINFNVGTGGAKQNNAGTNGYNGVATTITNTSGSVLAQASGGGGGKYTSDNAQINNTYGVGAGKNPTNWNNWTGLDTILGGQNGGRGNLTSEGYKGGKGGSNYDQSGKVLLGGIEGGIEGDGGDAPSISYGAGGGGGGGVQNSGGTPGKGGAGASGFIYVEWGGTTGGGGSGGEVIDQKQITGIKFGEVAITIGSGGVEGDGGITSFGTYVSVKGGLKGGNGGMVKNSHGKGAFSVGNGSYIGLDGEEALGGNGGKSLYRLAKPMEGVGGCGGNVSANICNGFTDPTPLGKSGALAGGGGGGGAIKDSRPYKGGNGGNGIVIIEWE